MLHDGSIRLGRILMKGLMVVVVMMMVMTGGAGEEDFDDHGGPVLSACWVGDGRKHRDTTNIDQKTTVVEQPALRRTRRSKACNIVRREYMLVGGSRAVSGSSCSRMTLIHCSPFFSSSSPSSSSSSSYYYYCYYQHYCRYRLYCATVTMY